ncbi:conserved hypothetical protein [uncultured Desulfobacterium sp.]|uniref:4Fe-4S ferredoxin-type domain-containing protein n=1 Tax=uncultured Desulfobacterium sp. TaxID=201089 RepID=A0A445MUU1_9BACT|nr:conserved hypothetical protein [uncultured Desulfobacterium sp.]
MKEDRQFLERIKREVLYGRDIAPPRVNTEDCKGCGQCVRVCVARVFELREKKSVVRYGENCFACGQCWAACPEKAVIQDEVVTAENQIPGPAPAVSPDMLRMLIRERRSTRLFTDKPVTKEELLQIIEAGRYTPSATNRQNVRYIVLSDKETVSQLRSLVEEFLERTFKAVQNKVMAPFLKMRMGSSGLDALRYYAVGYQLAQDNKEKEAYFPLPFGTAVIIVHAESDDYFGPFNCSTALSNCSLMAHSMGLGSCFLGFVQIGANADKNIKNWLKMNRQGTGKLLLT